MAEITLTPLPRLGGINKSIGGSLLRERDDLALVSVAVPLGGDAALGKALKAGWKLAMPKPTQTTQAGDMRAISIAADQVLLAFPHATPDANAHVQGKLKGAGYTTDHTDNLVVLDLSGDVTLAALERLCPIDLHLDAFPVGASARTVMEHMGALILRLDEDHFWLMAASSSAGSFLHAVETSLHYVA